ncbi:polyphosphate kinase [Methanolinea mesophila]|uniref:polyphosphate kinase 1 n=1 Tax=Methanolinea mesophila TaxID=547055 RepID=UPI001AE7F423|nr:polyphosphate kinase 1 [Methanolinea mesophila]MBP1928114.1 polyphosphate kinase [Methanolinea mesophila]
MPNGPPPEQRTGALEESPALFINRELSWIEFNRHVLEEAKDTSHPLLERVKFLAIFSNNLDEFFMIRVSGLQRQVERGVRELPPDGMSPSRQLEAVKETLAPLLEQQSVLWKDDLVPALGEAGIRICLYHDLDSIGKMAMRDYFIREIFPVLTPLAFDKSHPFPFISNLSLNLAAVVRDNETGEEHFARVKIPASLFSRLMKVPGADERGGRETRIFLEDLISANLDLLFPGLEVVASYPFRVTRDADLEIEEDEASDLLTAVEESVELRRVGSPVRVEVTPDMPGPICAMMAKMLGISQSCFYRQRAPLGMADLMALLSIDRPDLKDVPFTPSVPAAVEQEDRIFSGLRGKDLLLFHPYESFSPVIAFLRQAARDEDVLAIKITLYRVGPNSPIVDALLEARENGKAVAALIELKARFDEENNIGWARALERAGVHVVYGLVGLKVHAKVCMVVRREKQGIVRYMHMGTGNYNASSARVYTDLGLFSTDPVIGADVADLFNSLTGCARIRKYRKLLVAPLTIRSEIIARIEREILRHRSSGDGCIVFKMNALVDRECIMALYRASCEGVRVVLQVRGICCLRPGIPGVSENITVTSIVGRFLEHARVYYFRNGGDEEVFLGSADLMPRNLDRRVEVLFPVEDPHIRRAIADTLIPVHLRDTTKARRLLPDGTYVRVETGPGETACNAQKWCIQHRGSWQDERGV